MDIYGFTISRIVTFLLVLARVGGIFTVAPIFGNVNVAPMVRVAIAACLAFVFLPMANYNAANLDILAFVLVMGKEVLIGLIMGFLASLMFSAIQMAGSFIDLQVGFGFASIVDPMTKQQNAVIGQLYNLAATLLFLAINGHHMMLRGLADSFTVMPLGAMNMTAQASADMIRLFSIIFISALKISAPVVGAIFLTDVSLGILSRTVPQLNVFVVGLPAKLAVGLMTVIIVLPVAFGVMIGLFSGLHNDLLTILKYLS
jgi:flagellar biosynthesis protein FliR